MLDRTLSNLTRSIEAVAAQALRKPARVLWLEDGESALEAQSQYFSDNPELIGRIEYPLSHPAAA
jgi:hypothetical protein